VNGCALAGDRGDINFTTESGHPGLEVGQPAFAGHRTRNKAFAIVRDGQMELAGRGSHFQKHVVGLGVLQDIVQ